MRKFIILPVFGAFLLLLTTLTASADSQNFQQDFHGATGNVDLFTLNLFMCDECFPDDLDTDPGYSAIGAQLGIDGNVTWDATNQSALAYTPDKIRQGSTLDTVTTTFTIPGSATVNYHIYGNWGLYNDPDKDGPDPYNPTNFTEGVEVFLTSTIPCAMPLHGGVHVCEKDEYWEIASIHVIVAQLKLRLKVTTTIEMDSSGVIGMRFAVAEGGQPIPDAPISYIGSNPGLFVDPLHIACTQPVGADFAYGYKDMRVEVNSITNWSAIRINLAATEPFGEGVFGEIDTPALVPLTATWGNGMVVETPDLEMELGEILPDITPPTLDADDFFIGYEGTPIQFSADADDNCGAPSLRWEFSDGGVAFGSNPEHTFIDNGLYTGIVTATDINGLETVSHFEIAVLNAAPTVDAGPDKVADWGQTVAFNANGADAGLADHFTLQYAWNFGDPNSQLGAVGAAASHVYSEPGMRTATVTVTDKEGASASDTVNVIVTRRDTSIGFTGSNVGRISDAILLRAGLVDEYGQPVVGRTVTFRVDGMPVGSATTEALGIAQMQWTIPASMSTGLHTVTAGFNQDSHYFASASNAAALMVDSEVTVLTYTGPASAKAQKPVTLTASLTDDEGAPLAGRTVSFTLGTQGCSATTDATGKASCTIAKLTQKTGNYTVVVSYGGETGYLPAASLTAFKIGK